MAIRSTRVTVTTTAAVVAAASDADSNASYRDIALANTGSAPVYIGGSNVTASDGFPLNAGESITFSQTKSRPYAVVASGTGTLAVLEAGV